MRGHIMAGFYMVYVVLLSVGGVLLYNFLADIFLRVKF